MQFLDPRNGNLSSRKTRIRYDIAGDARELTFSCFRRFKFLERDRTRTWFIEELEIVRKEFSFDLWAYVIMPEHVHLLVYPHDDNTSVGSAIGKLKERVSRLAVQFLKQHSSIWLDRIKVIEGKKTRHRFWQPGGGYDRNATELTTVHKMIDYIHYNPVRRGLVNTPEDW